jgi:hypothetical protein
LLLVSVHATLISLLLPHDPPLALLCSAHGFLSALRTLARDPLSLCAVSLAGVVYVAVLARGCPALAPSALPPSALPPSALPPSLPRLSTTLLPPLPSLPAALAAMAWPDVVSLLFSLFRQPM